MAATGVLPAVRGLFIAVLLFGIAGCDQSDADKTSQSSRNAPGAPQAAFAAAAPAAFREAAGVADAPAQQKRIAVSHMYRLRLPSGEVERVQRVHIEACVKLGCDILNTR